MLNKLSKYEFKSTGRILLPVFGGVLGLCALAALLMRLPVLLPVLSGAGWFTVLSVLVMMVTVLGLVAMMLCCVFINVQSFYRLLGQQGYLMLTLPVSTNQHIAAKLLAACGWTLVSFVDLMLCVMLLMAGAGENPLPLLSIDWTGGALAPVFFLVFFLLGLMGSYLFFYLCIAVGGQWPQQRLLASIISYFVITFALQILSMLLLVLVGVSAYSLFHAGNLQLSATPGTMYAFMAAVCLLFAAGDAILWLTTRYFMTKKLNLA